MAPSFEAIGQAISNRSPKRIPTKTGPHPKMERCYWRLQRCLLPSGRSVNQQQDRLPDEPTTQLAPT
ncbi:hypothetical protein NG797_16380 [Laspinema sp. D5]|nr:hypothetical protein [Laspinema sp. D3d]